ncbi:hypothetical protein ABZS66_56835, partial [Dactylosporangium sp. NPDC005572]|uniref:hypothetical protein n=1 Tax=Dactylosporangium sp. NPDC005572 TaxID=3156889 RepID=UPI0033ADE2B0
MRYRLLAENGCGTLAIRIRLLALVECFHEPVKPMPFPSAHSTSHQINDATRLRRQSLAVASGDA